MEDGDQLRLCRLMQMPTKTISTVIAGRCLDGLMQSIQKGWRLPIETFGRISTLPHIHG